MNGLQKSINELINMLIQYEAMIKKFASSVLIGEASTSKAKGKRGRHWKRKKGKAKAKIVIVAKDAKSAPDAPMGMGKGKKRMGTQQQSRANDICTYCREKGHWKRDCPNLSSDQGMFVVEVNMVTNSASWILDTDFGAHICNDLQVLQKSRKLSKDEVVLRLGDGKAVAAKVARSGFSYFITFTDDHLRYGYVYLMRYKSEAFVRFKEFRLEVENQTCCKIKTLRSDRGREYLSGEFIDYPKENSIVSQWTPPGMPQLNGVAKRRYQTLLDMIRSVISFTELSLSFWGYTLETAARLLNIAPSKTVAHSP
ncbi:UNVERIFIED_CONTAM: hypothetical protein Sangu_2456600 [Sesamum angustifolium]|uniref:Retrotransposon protein, putative, Ty1-copia subclass n=1 Tax=Sesamum angustifolium TaxID=2727405 RepID=A0AAW2KZ26_9LAMI